MDLKSAVGWGRSPLQWGSIVFIGMAHLLAVAGIIHLILDFSWWTLGLGAVWYFLCGLSITGGYHRLFAHRSYRANPLLRLGFLCFGAAACQHSALKWCRDHRVHHRHTDEANDPYSVSHGFWWAHIGWVLHQGVTPPEMSIRDLENDPLVRFQDRMWLGLALFFGAALPCAIGLIWGDPIGALLVACFLRLVITWHTTFSVNSFTHRFGKKPYSDEESARDSFWVALLTLGEGYHNFHHRFQTDYRNGVRWYHYDPTKWLVWSLSRFGLTGGLVRIPRAAILRARQSGAAEKAA